MIAAIAPSCFPVLSLDAFSTFRVDKVSFCIKLDLVCTPAFTLFPLEPGVCLVLEGQALVDSLRGTHASSAQLYEGGCETTYVRVALRPACTELLRRLRCCAKKLIMLQPHRKMKNERAFHAQRLRLGDDDNQIKANSLLPYLQEHRDILCLRRASFQDLRQRCASLGEKSHAQPMLKTPVLGEHAIKAQVHSAEEAPKPSKPTVDLT